MAGAEGEWISIAAGGGETFDAWVCSPAKPNGHAIVLLQEIFGVNGAIRAQAADFAAQGYLTVAPDMFWRMQRRVDLGYDRDGMKAAFGFLARFDDAAAVDDVASAAAWVAAQPGYAQGASIVGFCLGGKIAALSAGRPNIRNAVCFYGVDIDKRLDALSAPHAPIQMHFGGKDKYVPPEAVAAIRAFAEGKPGIEIHHYPEADHGFFGKGRHSYDAAAAAAAWQRAEAFIGSPGHG